MSSINRNIVECKFAEYGGCRDRLFVLIETLWNVNILRTLHLPERT